jgi:hypothetical protein
MRIKSPSYTIVGFGRSYDIGEGRNRCFGHAYNYMGNKGGGRGSDTGKGLNVYAGKGRSFI